MADFTLTRRARATVIDDDATLDDGVRAAADLENDTNKDNFADFYLTVQWNTTAPSAGDLIAELYVMPGDGEVTEAFPEGGDAGLGTDDDPQAHFLVGVFESINPSLTVDEELAIKGVDLRPSKNRVVLKNVSGQQFDLTWQLDAVTFKWSSA